MKILLALAFVMILNVVLFFSNTAISDFTEVEANYVFSYDNSSLANYDAGEYVVVEADTGTLPTAEGSTTDTDTGNIFTDIFNTLKNWFNEATGFSYFLDIINAFPNLLKNMGLPVEVSFALGALWHSITLILIILVLTGRI